MKKEWKTEFDESPTTYTVPPITKGKTYIYALIDDGGSILYVGKTTHLTQRITQHRKEKDVFCSYMFFECDPSCAMDIEHAMYKKYLPPWNKKEPLRSRGGTEKSRSGANASAASGSQKLKQYLKEHGLTQAQFAERIGITRMGLSHILCGRRRPSTRLIIKIVEATEGKVTAEDCIGEFMEVPHDLSNVRPGEGEGTEGGGAA